ncbi:hypothetical protein HHI36_020645 [Cryptolaemus montrouzieri]|uniref:Uncharacterized protein n=1 Tax=Cryptolaemus montrouzieri TaxID=559131 RepID=A0ABD2NAV0_9CUCU
MATRWNHVVSGMNKQKTKAGNVMKSCGTEGLDITELYSWSNADYVRFHYGLVVKRVIFVYVFFGRYFLNYVSICCNDNEYDLIIVPSDPVIVTDEGEGDAEDLRTSKLPNDVLGTLEVIPWRSISYPAIITDEGEGEAADLLTSKLLNDVLGTLEVILQTNLRTS